MNGEAHDMTQTNSATGGQTLTDQLRGATRFIIDPIVSFLAWLGISPNMITVAGFLIHIPIAWFLSQGQWRLKAILERLNETACLGPCVFAGKWQLP